jgi:small-conductance mechanosensitive channel
MCVTRIRTVKNEEVHLANSLLLGTASTNYSRLANSDGLYLPARVSVGYSTPWRQVHAMLLQAARQTPGICLDPEPFVLQTALGDFYVQYELNARLERPERRVWVQSDLHCNILDIFNEHGVQIMSPHYMADPLRPQVVPKADWSPPPVSNGSTNGPSAGQQQAPQPGLGPPSASRD